MKGNLQIPKRFKIIKIVNENPYVKTFHLKSFEKKISEPKPGNFVMVWLPYSPNNNSKFDSDEKPMSISDYYRNCIAITVKKIGNFTNEVHKLKVGMELGITGPLGNFFKIKGKKIILVGGGVGIAPLRFLAKSAKNNHEIYAIFGAKTKSEVLQIKGMEGNFKKILIATDDGTFGKMGFATDFLDEFCKNFEFEEIFCCGPEIMMKKVLDFAIKNEIPAQFSLERYMYCGKGLCGFCCVDNKRVCKDGPIFDSETLSKIKDFGRKRRTKEGILVDL